MKTIRSMEVRRLTGGYTPGVAAFGPCSFDLAGGDLEVVHADNGAGKTALVHALVGALAWQAGEILFDGLPPERQTWLRMRRQHVAVSFQRLRVFGALSPADNLTVSAADPTRIEELEEHRVFSAVAELRKVRRPARRLSGGEQGLMSLACAYVSLREPGFLILDEPFASLHRRLWRDLAAMLAALVERGNGVLVTEVRGGPALDQLSGGMHTRLYELRTP